MIEVFLRTMLGTAGYRLMELYTEHALPINIVIFAYIGLIYLGRRSYQAMKKAIQEQIENISAKSPISKPETWFAKILKNNPIDWEKVSISTRIPFFSPDNYYWFGLKNEKAMIKHFSPKRITSWYAQKQEQTNSADNNPATPQ